MVQKNPEHKLRVVLVVMLVVCSGLLVMLSNIKLHNATGASTWIQKSDIDFYNGTLDNTTIIGTGEAAKVSIDLTKTYEWTEKSFSNKPRGRYGHSMASIIGTDKVVLFGGFVSYTYFLDDTWVYDTSDNTWTNKTTLIKPSKRYAHAMASIDGTDKIVMFGGATSLYTYARDTWIYDLSENSWTNRTPMIGPNFRAGHKMATISGDDKIVLFGGSPDPYSFIDETWVYDFSENTWTNKSPMVKPSPRTSHSMASVVGDDKVVLFGGFLWGSISDETWIYDLSDNTWTKNSPTIKPCARFGQGMAPIYITGKVILFGGQDMWNHPRDDTWVYDVKDNTWVKITQTIKPGGRIHTEMAAIYGTDKVLLFGGYNNKDDTWLFKYYLPSLNGTYISKAHDTGSRSSFKTISWDVNTPINTSIKLQVRSAANSSNLAITPFVGPDGKSSTYYNATPTNLWQGHNGHRWIQYKIYLAIYNFTLEFPSLGEVTISYNCLPETIVQGPMNGTILTNNKPEFLWTFIDFDSENQQAFQLVIDNDLNFESVTYDSGEQSTNQQRWQFPSGTSYTELPDGTWYWKVRTKDEDNEWTEYSSPMRLIIDTHTPTSATIFPVNNEIYKSLRTISGIATDPAPSSGLNQIEVSINRLSDNYYWNGTSWVPLTTWVVVSGTTNWTYDSSNIPWSSNDKYIIRSRAVDNATNLEQSGLGITFIIDLDTPISYIDHPTNNTWLNVLNSISGSSIDFGGSPSNIIEICINSIDDNNYWNGTSWSSEEYWLPTIGTEQWSYDSSTVQWKTGFQYIIRSRAADMVGNIEVPSFGKMFRFDNQPPEALSININNDEEYTNNINVILSLHTEDMDSGVSKMSFCTDNKTWSPWEPFNTSRVYELPMDDEEKFVFVRVCDCVGNIAEPVFDSIVLDTTPPNFLSIKINRDAKYSNSITVWLNLYATDSGSGLGNMSLSYNAINWFINEPFKVTRSISLSKINGDGEKIVYFKVSDLAGNTANPVFDTIILDTTPPEALSLLINNGASETNSTKVTLNLNAKDVTSGIYQISLSADNQNWSTWEDYIETKMYTLSTPNGIKTVYFKVKDNAGNIASPVSATILLNTTSQIDSVKSTKNPPAIFSEEYGIILLMVIIVLLILITGILSIVFKRNKNLEQKLLTGGALSIKPGGWLGPVIAVEKMPIVQEPKKLPGITIGIAGQPGQPQTTVPTLTSTPTVVPQLVQHTQFNEQTNQQASQESSPVPKLTGLPQLPQTTIADDKTESIETTQTSKEVVK